MTEPLRKLLNKDVVWESSSKQIKAFETPKKMVTETPVLQFFDPKLNVRVSADSPQSGLGAILEQEHPKNEWKPVAFASRSLSQGEKNYARIEKECLSVVFATNRFHEYCYGCHFDVLNDHKPLQGIFSSLSLMHLQGYRGFYSGCSIMTLIFTMFLDCLSRDHLDESKPEIPENELNQHVHSLISNFL